MPPKTDDIEDRITRASEAIDNDPTLKGTKAAAKFQAPYDRLIAWRRGRPASYTRGRHNKKLSTPQDSSLKDYCLMLYVSRCNPNLDVIQTSATRLVYYEAGDTDLSVLCRWTKAWIARNSDWLKRIREKLMSAKRLSAYIVEDVK